MRVIKNSGELSHSCRKQYHCKYISKSNFGLTVNVNMQASSKNLQPV